MKKHVLFFLMSMIVINLSFSQKVRWSYKIEGSNEGAGKMNTWKAGFNKYCAAVIAENEEGKKLKKNAKDPGIIHYSFMPFDAQQLIISENYNPGAISKITIGYRPNNEKKPLIKTIYEGETKASDKEYVTSNYNFELTKNITDVYVYMDYVKIPGVNQIAGVALADFKEPYKPWYHFAKEEPFEGDPMFINDDVSGVADPTAPVLTVDGKYIYFNHNDGNHTKIYRGEIGSNGKLKKVEYSVFNLPNDKSTASSLTAISQDNNVAYVNDLTVGKLNVYKTYLKKNWLGNLKWEYDKLSINGFKSESKYINDIMSYDGQFYIVDMERKDGEMKYFDGDIYVAFRNEKGGYDKFIRMGDDINTTGDEIPCFLAADNKTFFFASDGHIGYGKKDIYVTRRLDDTWQNWSQPLNLGPIINSSAHENAFAIDSKGEYAYFIRWEKSANIYRIKLRQPKKEELKSMTIKPEPVVIIKGKVLDKKTNLPLQAEILYTDLLTGKSMGTASSNGETGDYSIALPIGLYYSYLAKSNKYLTVSENVDAREIGETSIIEKNLYLVPLEVGQIIRLNNIFFDFGKATLRPESYIELDEVVNVLKNNSKMEIEMSGHTDNVGSEDANLKLSEDRAKAVKDYIVSKGISENRIISKGYGKSKPITSNDTDEGRQLNRRVEFTILKN